MEKKTKGFVVAVLCLVAALVVIWVAALVIKVTAPLPTQYISANLFPLFTPPSVNGYNFVLYGKTQTNGTACISSGTYNKTTVNYTTMKTRVTTGILSRADIDVVVNVDYSGVLWSRSGNIFITQQDGYTLLCPNK